MSVFLMCLSELRSGKVKHDKASFERFQLLKCGHFGVISVAALYILVGVLFCLIIPHPSEYPACGFRDVCFVFLELLVFLYDKFLFSRQQISS